MRAALIIDSLAGGGAEQAVHDLAIALREAGLEIFVYCLKTPNRPLHDLHAVGVRVRQCTSPARFLGTQWQLCRWLRQDRVQLVNTHSSAAAVAAFAPARLAGARIVHTRHGDLLGKPSVYRRIANRLSPFFDGVSIVAESLRPRLSTRGLRAVAAMTPNGIDLPAPDPHHAERRLKHLLGRAPRGPVILSIGSIAPEKDPASLVQAFGQLLPHFPHAELVIAGGARDPVLANELRTSIAGARYAAAVHLVGPVPDAWQLMAAADLLCLASQTEAAPYVILEAMSQRTPIVATAVGDVGTTTPGRARPSDLLRSGDTALLVPAGCPSRLAAALRATLADRDQAKQRAHRAHDDYQSRFTRAAMASSYIDWYRRVRPPCKRRNHLRSDPRPTVGQIGPPPRQLGGINSVMNMLMAGPLAEHYDLKRFDLVPPSRTDRRSCRTGWLQRLDRGLDRMRAHLTGLLRLNDELRRRRPALLHIHTCSRFSWHRNVADLCVARLLRIPTILHIHGGRFEEFCRDAGPLQRRLIRWGAERAARVVVLADWWRDRLRPYLGAARLAVVPNGVAPATLTTSALHAAPQTCHVIFLGKVCDAKGIPELLEAARRLRSVGVSFKLTLIGDGDPAQLAAYHEFVAQYELQQVISFIGPLRGAAKDRLLNDADLLVLPSRAEGAPIVILEAAIRAIPVVATRVGAVSEMLSFQPAGQTPCELATLIPVGDEQALTDALRDLAQDARRRERMGRRLQRHVETHYTLDRQALKLASLYRRLLDEKTLRRLPPAPRRSASVTASIASQPPPFAALLEAW